MEKKSGAKIIQSLFDPKQIPDDAKKILQDFDQIAQSSMPANSKQLVALPKQIRELSHQMTDDRGSRRLGYMNEKTFWLLTSATLCGGTLCALRAFLPTLTLIF